MNDRVDLATLFRCPYCRGDLRFADDRLQCAECDAQFPIDQGIPCFVPGQLRTKRPLSSYDRDLDRRHTDRATANAVRKPAAGCCGVQGIETANQRVNREARADFRFMMPLDGNDVVLYIGSCTNIPMAFARIVRCVIALDTSLEGLHLLQRRAQEEGLYNIIGAQGDACTLPLRPASCNAALMVGGLARVVSAGPRGAPQRLQKQALQRIRCTLKSGGSLCLGAENRFGFRYFLGAKQSDTGLRVISIVPNRLAKNCFELARQQDYREITHSLWGLEKLLHSVGFNRVDFFFPIPDYQNPRFVMDLEDKGVARFVVEQLRAYPQFSHLQYLAARILVSLPLCLQRSFWPSFIAVATCS
ncbi:MAG: hypothetical protein ACOC6F_01780 [bacterium]